MRSYFVYVRTTDNQFFSSAIALENPQDPKAIQRVYKHFQDKGNPLPPAQMIYSFRLVADPRNLTDMAGYEESRPHGESEGYVAYSEYTSGVTPTN